MENNTGGHRLIHNLDNQDVQNKGVSYTYVVVIILIAIVLGTAIGFSLTKIPNNSIKSASSLAKQNASGKTAGVANSKSFKDKAEGVLKEGGINGEGNFHLERPGGESQNVYLTSTTVDLSEYVNKKIRVYGETFKGQNAGWLMDVGMVETL